MSVIKKINPVKRLWAKAREYLTHWFLAGTIVALTGFAPDHWIANLFHSKLASRFLESALTPDYRLVAVIIGVCVITADIVVRNLKTHKRTTVISPAVNDTRNDTRDIVNPFIENIDDTQDRTSIAVLPFVNNSSDQDHEYFADGMTEDIINRLSCESRLFVIARNSTFAYKGQSPDIRAVGKELGVRYVLEGGIRPVNDRLRINVQLVETTSGTHVWADNIDRPMTEILDIIDDVVNGMVTALCSNLGLAEANRVTRQCPEDLQAWALSVRAETVYLSQPGAESLVSAEKLLRRAIEIEPDYGVGWAFLAYLTSVKSTCGLSANPSKDTDEALSLANEALRLAPNDPLVLGYSGVAYTWAGQTARAIDCLERSLNINPNNGVCRLFYGAALWADGRPEAGIEQLDIFLRLSPKDPNSGFAYHFYSYCFLALGDFQQAAQSARKVVSLMPGFAGGYIQLGMALTALGDRAVAREQIQKAREIAPARSRPVLEDFWRLVVRKPEQAVKMIALTRQAWADEAVCYP